MSNSPEDTLHTQPQPTPLTVPGTLTLHNDRPWLLPNLARPCPTPPPSGRRHQQQQQQERGERKEEEGAGPSSDMGEGGGPPVAVGADGDHRPTRRCHHHPPLRMHMWHLIPSISPTEAAVEAVVPGLRVGEDGSLPPTTSHTTLHQFLLPPVPTGICPSSILPLPWLFLSRPPFQ